MSTSIQVVHVAAVSSERFMCSPICRRMRDSVRDAAAAATCDCAGSGRYGLSMWSGASSTAPASRNASTSCFAPARRGRCRPPGSGRRRAPRRSAGRRGSSGARWPAPRRGRGAWDRRSAGGLGSGVAPWGWAPRGLGALAGVGAGAAADRRPPRRNPRQHLPDRTVVSTDTRISETMPLTGEGTSVSILSVEISQIVSSAAIGSPTLDAPRDQRALGDGHAHLRHRHVDDRRGRASVREELTARLPDSFDGRQHRLLERR